MKYTVKQVEDKLGITRKVLRKYEEIGLIDKKNIENPVNKYREYDEEDLIRIWFYRTLTKIGYRYSDLEAMVGSEFDFYSSLSNKIKELEKEKEELEKRIEYAKTIKLFGYMPSHPTEIGEEKFDDFFEKVKEEWNFAADTKLNKYCNVIQKVLNGEESFTEEDLINVEAFYEDMKVDKNAIIVINNFYHELIKFSYLEVENLDIQRAIKNLYDFYCSNIFKNIADIEQITPQKFAKVMVPVFEGSDIAKINEKEYGREGCKFIADAICYFGEHYRE